MPSTPAQELRRRRFETVIGLAAPVLDFVLAAGEKVSRVVAPQEDDYFAIRAPWEQLELWAFRRPATGGEPTVE